MTEYAITVFAICAVVGVLSLISYGSGRAESLSLAIITLFIIAAPVVRAVGSFDMEGWLSSFDSPDYEVDSEYGEVLRESFAEGISLAVADKFSLNKEDIRVRLSGFDAQNMRADSIKIILSGRAVFADYKAVESYIDRLEMGECSVEIEIG